MAGTFTHLDDQGKAVMVDVGAKNSTEREAEALAHISMSPETLALIKAEKIAKGEVLGTARIAGIMAAKRTPELIPLCHPLMLEKVSVDFSFQGAGTLQINSRVKTTGKTGVEMEALTAVSVAALTVYDMCKAVDKELEIGEIYLLSKRGGRSGDYRRTKT